jgi:hypothetical protein
MVGDGKRPQRLVYYVAEPFLKWEMDLISKTKDYMISKNILLPQE